MSFFRNFPLVNYRFGDEISPALFQNITAYIDIIDQIADDAVYYENYTIQDDERPDTLSYSLYGTVDNYWTFFLINDKLRQQGWPLSTQEVYDKVKDYYPNFALTTDYPIYDGFVPGDYVATKPFSNPPFKGRIMEKDLSKGQMIVKPSLEVRSISVNNGGSGYTSIPTVTIKGGGGRGAKAQAILDSDTIDIIAITDGGDDYKTAPTVTISAPDIPRGEQATATANLSSNNISVNTDVYTHPGLKDTTLWEIDVTERYSFRVNQDVAYQWNATHHYENADGEWVDLDINAAGKLDFSAGGLDGKKAITHLDRLIRENNQLKEIKVIKPDVVNQVINEYQRLLRS